MKSMHNKEDVRQRYLEDLFLRLLLEGHREIGEHEAEERKRILKLDQLQLPCKVVCIAPDYSQILPQCKDKMVFSCEKYVASYFEKKSICCCTITNSYENVQCILHVKDDNICEEELLIQLHERILLDLGLQQFIGIGSKVGEYGKIAVSAAEATDMLAYKYQYAERGVINISNIVRFQHNSNFGHNEMFDRVIGCFQDGDLARMAVRLDELIKEIRYRPNVSNTSIKRTMVELTVHLLTIASNAKVDVDSLLKGEDPYKWIIKQDTTEIITEWIMNLASQLLIQMQEQQKTQEKKIIQSACEYIQRKLGETTLGLQSVCEYVGLSGPYLSQVFKKEKGIGLNNFITNQRIRTACMLLASTDLKNSDISIQTGFSSVNYFSSVFKKEMGLTPKEYKRLVKNTGDLNKKSE